MSIGYIGSTTLGITRSLPKSVLSELLLFHLTAGFNLGLPLALLQGWGWHQERLCLPFIFFVEIMPGLVGFGVQLEREGDNIRI